MRTAKQIGVLLKLAGYKVVSTSEPNELEDGEVKLGGAKKGYDVQVGEDGGLIVVKSNDDGTFTFGAIRDSFNEILEDLG